MCSTPEGPIVIVGSSDWKAATSLVWPPRCNKRQTFQATWECRIAHSQVAGPLDDIDVASCTVQCCCYWRRLEPKNGHFRTAHESRVETFCRLIKLEKAYELCRSSSFIHFSHISWAMLEGFWLHVLPAAVSGEDLPHFAATLPWPVKMARTASKALEATAYSKVCNAWSTWPLTAKVCFLFTPAQLLACIYACVWYEVGPMFKGAKEDELEIFSMARNALIIPMALITLVAMYQVVEMCSAKPRHRALIISRLSMFLFMVKMTYYTLLSRGYGLAFQNQRCYDLRPIYGARYAGWTFAVPTVIFMNLYPLMDEHRLIDVLIRLFPQMATTMTYCWAAGLGCILYDPWMGWFLCGLACLAYVPIVADEIAFVGEHISTTSQPLVKGISIGIKNVMFWLYTLWYLLGNWGFMSSYAVQASYSATDIGHIAVMSSLLFLYWNVDDVKQSGKHQDWSIDRLIGFGTFGHEKHWRVGRQPLIFWLN